MSNKKLPTPEEANHRQYEAYEISDYGFSPLIAC